MQSGNLVAGVVLRIRQLWLSVEQLRLTGRPLIDSWKQIDQVYTRCTGRGEMNDDLPKACFQRLESVAAYAAADECLPHQSEHVIGRKTFALQMDVRSNRTLGWR